jgi:hypothetical protein
MINHLEKVTGIILSVIILMSVHWVMLSLDHFLWTRLLPRVAGQRDFVTRDIYVSQLCIVSRLVMLGTEISIVLLGVNCTYSSDLSWPFHYNTIFSPSKSGLTPGLSIWYLQTTKDGADFEFWFPCHTAKSPSHVRYEHCNFRSESQSVT